MWVVKTKLKPVITREIGSISKSFRKYLSKIPGKQGIHELQKTATFGTAHLLRKILM
jgi:hypothetical protein